MTSAIIDAGWAVVGLSPGWRRRTGVLRADLLAAPLLCYIHPEEVPEMIALGGLLDHAAGHVRVRMGYWGRWVEVRLEGERRAQGLIRLDLVAPELPRSRWMRPSGLGLPHEPAPVPRS